MAAIAFAGGAEVLLTTLASTFCLIVLLLTLNSQLSTLNSQANQPDRSFHPLSCLLGRFIYQFQKKNYLFIHFPFVFFFFFFVFVILKSFISINFLTLTIVRGIFGTTSQVSPRPIGFIQQQNNGRITRTKKIT